MGLAWLTHALERFDFNECTKYTCSNCDTDKNQQFRMNICSSSPSVLLFLSPFRSQSHSVIFILIRYHLIQLPKSEQRDIFIEMKWFTTMLTAYYTINAATILIFEPNLILYKYMHACIHVCCLVNTTHQKSVCDNNNNNKTLVLHLCKLKWFTHSLCAAKMTR